ncbi:hypothetical protein EVAR_9418_1 [Eumeta japonica]|uniref:Uncharacterized protein n=1 Tax=Eumeta variegata TaxID=151549 RepID=A0A4C1UDW3_EUMVA|nr:hypothetical protein EVAR_9418_1 [Eumeta japonica]
MVGIECGIKISTKSLFEIGITNSAEYQEEAASTRSARNLRRLYGEPGHAFTAMLCWTASSIFCTRSFIVAIAQAHEAYSTIGLIPATYMVLTTSGFKPHVTLAAQAKPL